MYIHVTTFVVLLLSWATAVFYQCAPLILELLFLHVHKTTILELILSLP